MLDDSASKSRRMTAEEAKQYRLKAVALFVEGLTQADVARTLGVSRMAVSRWHRTWRAFGMQPLMEGRRPGKTPKLSDAEIALLEPKLRTSPKESGFDKQRWTLGLVAALILREYGIDYHPSQVQKILNALGWFHEPRGRPKRGSKSGRGRFAWRKRAGIQGKGRRKFKPENEKK